MINNSFKGFTLIEMAATLTIASAFSIGLFYVFLNANKAVSNDEVVYDIKSYSTSALDIISDKIRNSSQISINTISGGGVTIITQNNDEEFRYSVVNNMIYENGSPLKLFGYKHLENQDFFEITMSIDCAKADVENTFNQNVEDFVYDLDITFNLESIINNNYQISHTASNRIFAINKRAQTEVNS
tara:strand:+ start:826 stop:1383 length:558 start_codon:yes stop_codon:yes gene_type:complete